MKYEVTQRGVYDAKGEMIEVGAEVEAKGDKMPGYLIGKAVPVKGGKTFITNPAKGGDDKGGAGGNDQPPAEFAAPVGPFTAKEKSPGWWSIFDGADQPVGKSVRKNDLEGFDTLSDDDKQAFATESAKAAFDKAAA